MSKNSNDKWVLSAWGSNSACLLAMRNHDVITNCVFLWPEYSAGGVAARARVMRFFTRNRLGFCENSKPGCSAAIKYSFSGTGHCGARALREGGHALSNARMHQRGCDPLIARSALTDRRAVPHAATKYHVFVIFYKSAGARAHWVAAVYTLRH